MVDVFTTEGSLYSGAFTTWVPSEESISDITMEYALRFYPRELINPECKKCGTTGEKKSRKKSLIKNNGELVIARERIESIHFWEIRRNFSVTVVVTEPQDIEHAKWFTLLAYVFPKYITRISIQVKIGDPEWNDFKMNFRDWIKESGILFEKGVDAIDFKIVRGPNSP